MNRLQVSGISGNRNSIRALAVTCLFSFLFAGQAAAETGDHQALYLDAIDRVTAGGSIIATEMTRIARGEVSHYDFLQYEHSELLRHARALRHPPARLAGQQRAEVIARAGSLIEVADSLELVIADFLRSQALQQSAVNNTRDLVAGLARLDQSAEQLDRLQQLDVLVSTVQGDSPPEALAALNAAYSAVLEYEPDPQRKAEFTFQNRLIQDNANGLEIAMQRLAGSGLKEQADSFQEYFSKL
jgi:hypothetical protein